MTAIYRAKANRFLISQGNKKKKRRLTIIIHRICKIVEELYLLFVWKTSDATKVTDGRKWPAAAMQRVRL